MSLLAVRNLRVAYGKVVALDRVSLTVDEGEVVTLVGANGAGKSTLLKALMGLLRPIAGGDIEFCQRPYPVGRATHEIARLGIAYVPEGRGTLLRLTVRENLRPGCVCASRNADIEGAKCGKVLDRFPVLGERIDQIAGTLSGGQQQMLVIARALMSRPRLMLLDEPSLGLAPLIARTIFEIIADLKSQGVTVLLVEQNAHAALKLASRAMLEIGRESLGAPI